MLTSGAADVSAALSWASEVLGSPALAVHELVGGSTGRILALTDRSVRTSVLRLITREPWLAHGAALTSRESEIQRMLAGSTVPAPESVALDATGDHCGHPAHLMTLVPGRVDPDRTDPESLVRLAELQRRLAAVMARL